MSKRINMLLPEKTVAVLDRVAKPGSRSRFIDRAVLHYVETHGKQRLREQLAAGYRANADRDLEMAAEWFPLEEEAWEIAQKAAGAVAVAKPPRQAFMTIPKRGDIYLVEFDPARGHEIKKTRPALVIQNDIGNRHSPVTIVAAITSKLSPIPYPVDVPVAPTRTNSLAAPSAIQLGQIRSVDTEP
jgi:mRNA interferase MazF